MRLIWFALKMESVDEVTRVCIDLFFWDALGYKIDVVGDADNGIIMRQFLIDFAVVCFVHTDRAFATFIVKFCFLDQPSN